MNFRALTFLGIMILLAMVPQTVTAQSDSTRIQQLLEERDREVKDLLGPKGTEYTQDQRDRLMDIINNIIDYRAMAQFALQQTYDTISTDQREEFVDLFSTIIRDQSLNKLDIYRAEVTYNSISVDDSVATVKTTAFLDEVRTPVHYEMQIDSETDEWVITDMTIDDVSTASSYRRQFQNIIRKRGFDYLMETLRKRAAR